VYLTHAISFFAELDMSYYIEMTDTNYYADEIFHLNPELCYFVLTVYEYYKEKYDQSKLLKTTPSAKKQNSKKKKEKHERNLDTNHSSETNELYNGFSNGNTETSLTNLLNEPDSMENLGSSPFKKVIYF
jgi:hypothetical protein